MPNYIYEDYRLNDIREDKYEYRERLNPKTNEIEHIPYYLERLMTYMEPEKMRLAQELIDENFANCAERLYIGAKEGDISYPTPALRLKGHWADTGDCSAFWQEFRLRETPEYQEKKKLQNLLTPSPNSSSNNIIAKIKL